jgi:hypothetical protein
MTFNPSTATAAEPGGGGCIMTGWSGDVRSPGDCVEKLRNRGASKISQMTQFHHRQKSLNRSGDNSVATG